MNNRGTKNTWITTPKGTKSEIALVLVLVNLCIGFLYFLFRNKDKTTLVNWAWLFQDIGHWNIYGAFLVASLLGVLWWRFVPSKIQYAGLLCATGGLLIYLTGIPEVVPDASRYFIQAKYLALNGPVYFLKNWGKEISAWTDLPLGPFLYGMLFRIAGDYRFLVQGLNILILVLCCIWLYRLGAYLWNPTAGILSVLTFLSAPYLLVQTPLMLVDILTMSLFTFILYLYTTGPDSTKSTLGTGLALALGLLSKYSLWLFLPLVVGLWVLLKEKKNLTMVISSSLIGVFIVLGFLFKDHVIIEQLDLLFKFQGQGLGHWKEPVLRVLLFHFHPFFLVLSVTGLLMLIRGRHRFWPVVAVALILSVVLGRGRYILPLVPLLSLAGGFALSRLYPGIARLVVALMIVTTAVLSGLYAREFSLYSATNLKTSAEWLNRSNCMAVQVQTLPQKDSLGQTAPSVAIFDLYYRGRIVSVQPWKTAPEDKLYYHPLFFTWKILRPDFYPARPFKETLTTVLIASREEQLSKAWLKFTRRTGHFRYRTLVGLTGQVCSLRPTDRP